MPLWASMVSAMGEATSDGDTTFTRTPQAASSLANVNAIVSRAAFDALYGPLPLPPVRRHHRVAALGEPVSNCRADRSGTADHQGEGLGHAVHAASLLPSTGATATASGWSLSNISANRICLAGTPNRAPISCAWRTE